MQHFGCSPPQEKEGLSHTWMSHELWVAEKMLKSTVENHSGDEHLLAMAWGKEEALTAQGLG